MADSSNTLPLISASQASKEVSANAMFLAGSPSMLFGVDPRTTVALTFGYLGGKYRKADGTILEIDDSTVALTASATNYVLETDGIVSKVTAAPAGWPGPLAGGARALYQIVCDASGVNPAAWPTGGWKDFRVSGAGGGGGSSVADPFAYKGAIDCSANPNYPAADAGDAYRVSVAGLIGGASGIAVEVGDTIYCTADGTAGGDQATVGTSWNILQVNVTASSEGAFVHGLTSKATPVDADELPLVDSAASNILKKLTWANLKATLKTYFDTLYAPLSQPFNLTATYFGVPTGGALVFSLAAPAGITTLTFAAALSGSSGKALVAATAQTDIDVRKNATSSSTGTSVGTIRFAAGATVPTFIAASGFTLTGGSDWLTGWAPATPDATLADVSVSLFSTR